MPLPPNLKTLLRILRSCFEADCVGHHFKKKPGVWVGRLLKKPGFSGLFQHMGGRSGGLTLALPGP